MPSSCRGAVLALAMVLSGVDPAVARQPVANDQYQRVVDRYIGGDHASAVVGLLRLRTLGLAIDPLEVLRERTRQYTIQLDATRVARRSGGAGRRATDLDRAPARLYLQQLRAMAALHLEAAIAVSPDRQSERNTHILVAETVFRELASEHGPAWTRDATVDAQVRAGVTQFRRDWWLIAATHFQRRGALDDARRFVGRAQDEFRDEAVFQVIEGSILETLSSPMAAFDGARVLAGLPASATAASREALQRAARSYERALVLQPGDSEARVRLARVLVRLGEFDAARPHLAHEAPPGRLAYLLALANGYAAEAQRHYDTAVGHYRDARAMQERWQSGCLALAHGLVKAGRQTEARATVQECLTREPAADDPWPTYPMGLEWLVDPTVRQLRARVSAAPETPHD